MSTFGRITGLFASWLAPSRAVQSGRDDDFRSAGRLLLVMRAELRPPGRDYESDLLHNNNNNDDDEQQQQHGWNSCGLSIVVVVLCRRSTLNVYLATSVVAAAAAAAVAVRAPKAAR